MLNIIPKPILTNKKEGFFTLSVNSRVFIDGRLAGCDRAMREFFPALTNAVTEESNADIRILYDEDSPAEGYILTVRERFLSISAKDKSGVLYALVTLRQMSFFSHEDKTEIPCCDISDFPRFAHRGLMLDESRHFFGKEEVKRLLRLMAFYKLNTFHWHLSDDQGWRVEIKKYPLLTEIGSKRKDSSIHGWNSADLRGEPHEGYYTQKDIKEIVSYAYSLGITIIPEIDMPAHFAAAMAAYNYLGCREIPCEVHWFFGSYIPSKMGRKDFNRSCCVGKESTYEFIFGVIDELAELFPAPYFHIGGDEAPKEEWKACPHCQRVMKEKGLKNVEELQGHFNNRVADYLRSKGKRLIVWNEALAAGNLDSTVIGQYWTDYHDSNVKKHLQRGGEVIISKHQAFYFDMCYGQYPLKNTLNFEAIGKMIPEELEDNVLGYEGELWTEWIADREKLDMQLFPRMQALSEICWTPRGMTNTKDFLFKLEYHKRIMDNLGINYAEDEIAMVRSPFRRQREKKLWHKCDQHNEVRRNRALKAKKNK